MTATHTGPLAGCRVIELAGIGPVPYAGMLLADLGAEVIRVDRADRVSEAPPASVPTDVVGRGRRSIGIDLKDPAGASLTLRLAARADVLLEGFRPGVVERLGVGPDECRRVNPALVYGRMSGWGQEGPLAPYAGHDINFLAVAGTLDLIGRKGQPPTPPLNLVGDYGGGGLLLALGVVAALYEARGSGRGQVVDTSMIDGTALITAVFHSLIADGMWGPERGTNLLDSGAPFYDAYECADGRFLAVGAIEPAFYAAFRAGLGLADDPLFDQQHAQSNWPRMKDRVAEVIATRTREEWCAVFDATDACVTPVLTLAEAAENPHIRERKTFVKDWGMTQPAPAPRFSRTRTRLDTPPASAGQHTAEILAEVGLSPEEIAQLTTAGTVR